MSRVDDIRARAEAATRGPWYQGRNSRRYENSVEVYSHEDMEHPDSCDVATFTTPEDAEFIAHAREDVPFLLAEVERLRAKNTELNRRCTKAEAFAGKTVEELRAKPGFAGFGRALANWAAADAHQKLTESLAEVERLEQELGGASTIIRALAARNGGSVTITAHDLLDSPMPWAMTRTDDIDGNMTISVKETP